ncbi:MAG: indolepyruvate oxidoreductase subunit beta, partial [Actinobacteria bacterium]|nr:indolepyruvate oxidoreductase subunit beta [Actinomycetota bacterium]
RGSRGAGFMTSTITNVLLAGVGGQGVLLAGEVVALVAAVDKKEVKQTEVHGVAQRGGSVVSHVRFGDRVYSPVIKRGDADCFLAFEKLEALRYGHWVRDGGVVIVGDQRVVPGYYGEKKAYPDDPEGFLRGRGLRVVTVPARERAIALGNHRVASLVMLGAASRFLDLGLETWESVIEERIPARLLEVNRRAFEEGRGLV